MEAKNGCQSLYLELVRLIGFQMFHWVIFHHVKVSNAIATKFGHEINWTPALTGAAAIDAVGDPYPDETHAVCEAADAVLFGAIGLPRFDNDPAAKVRPEQGLLRMRKKLGLFANVRPTFTFPSLLDKSPLKQERIEGTDLVFLRELTGGIYFGERGRIDDGNTAFDTCTYTRDEIIRLAKKGFELAMTRTKKLCCVDKANVLESSRLAVPRLSHADRCDLCKGDVCAVHQRDYAHHFAKQRNGIDRRLSSPALSQP